MRSIAINVTGPAGCGKTRPGEGFGLQTVHKCNEISVDLATEGDSSGALWLNTASFRSLPSSAGSLSLPWSLPVRQSPTFIWHF